MSVAALPIREEPALVGSVVQAIAILRHLGVAERPEGVTTIAKQLGISPSSCLNLLRTLVAEDLLCWDPLTKTYTLGLGTVHLARLELGRNAVVSATREAMNDLAMRFDAALGLWRVTSRDRLELVVLSESKAATRIHLEIGQRQPLAAGATGRAYLAACGIDDSAVAAAFAPLRWQTAPTQAEYLEQVGKARSTGWALDVSQINRGVTTAAAAITDARGDVRFCISASMFTGFDSEDRLITIGEALRDLAWDTARLVYGPTIVKGRS